MLQRILKRFIRVTVGTAIAAGVAYATNSKYAFILVPLFAALGKWAREMGADVSPV